MKYLIYARKSSEDDARQILSIGSQISELKEIAQKRNLEIIEVLEESKSAKAPGRPIFNEMMAKINSGQVDGILCWKLDRLARNPVDGGSISWLLQNGIIKSIQTFEKEYLPTDNVLLMNVEFGMANQFIRDLRINTTRGKRTKVENGWLPAIAPIGYLNDKVEKTIVKDSERFDLVRKIWDMVLTDNYSAAAIARIVENEWKLTTLKRRKIGGNPITRSSIYRILTNPFYYGWFDYNGQLYKGKQDPMITEDEFWRAQALLGRKGRARPKNHYFAYTGMIKCGECGCAITAEEKIKTNKTDSKVRHYTYYRCTKKRKDHVCSQSYIEQKELERQVDEFLKKIELDDEFNEWADKYMSEINEDESKSQALIYESLHRTKEAVQKQLNSLIDMRVKELISDIEYLERKSKLQNELLKINEKLGDTDYRAESRLELMERTFNFCHNVRYWFKYGSLEDKKIILKTIGSNLLLRDKILQLEPVKLFSIIAEGNKTGDWQRQGESDPCF